MLEVKALPTGVYRMGEDFTDFLVKNLKGVLEEERILAVTSKIVSLSENRVIPKSTIDKKDLIEEEADHYLGEIEYGCHLTIKQGLLIPSAGVDESNSEGDFYILYPLDPFLSAKRIHNAIKEKLNLSRIGVLLTDSHTMPLRRGVVGAALAYYGFKGVENKIGTKDLFGRELKMTQINIADALAVAATLTMGEGNEGRPLAIVNASVEFKELSDNSELRMPVEEDLYRPLLQKSLPVPGPHRD